MTAHMKLAPLDQQALPSILQPVIMCGGVGTRLWPSSRDSLPKQFAPLLGQHSSFQETVLRTQSPGFAGRPLIVASASHRHLVERQLREIGVKADILLEPSRRDSGPAIVAGCVAVAKTSPQAAALILAADHFVGDPAAFRAAVLSALPAAQAGRLVTFGITPAYPATGYGYIEPGAVLEGGAHSVTRFAEKPDFKTATDYIERGFLWNSGNFMFMPDALLDEYRALHPATVAAVQRAFERGEAGDGVHLLDNEEMSKANKQSVDYAVMEHTKRAAVVRLSCGWSDIGSWDALWSLSQKDDSGNVRLGDVELFDAENSYVSSDGLLTILLGVSDIAVVSYRDAVLVADRRRSSDIKKIVETLRDRGRIEADRHLRVPHAWGWHSVMDASEDSEVRRIAIGPHERLPAQKYDDRSIFWVAIEGEIRAMIGGTASHLKTSDHAVVPAGAPCWLENTGNTPAELIEVQLKNRPNAGAMRELG